MLERYYVTRFDVCFELPCALTKEYLLLIQTFIFNRLPHLQVNSSKWLSMEFVWFNYFNNQYCKVVTRFNIQWYIESPYAIQTHAQFRVYAVQILRDNCIVLIILCLKPRVYYEKIYEKDFNKIMSCFSHYNHLTYMICADSFGIYQHRAIYIA